MSKYPCGICEIGVKFQGIQCTNSCKRWFHAKCLSWSLKKFKNLTDNDIKNWSCDICKSKHSVSNMESLKSKIQDLSSGENFDPDESLTLAAELGNALLTENNHLKQQIHEIKHEKSQIELELEDKLNLAEEAISDLKGENQNLHCEITSLQSKLKTERELRDELIKQAEIESNSYTRQIKDLSSLNITLKDQIKNTEAIKSAINRELDDLKLKSAAQKTEMDILSSTLHRTKHEHDRLKCKLLEYNETIKSYIKTVSECLEPNLTPDYTPLPKPQSPRPTPAFCISEKPTEKMQHKTQESKITQPLNKAQAPKTSATNLTGSPTNFKTSKNPMTRIKKPSATQRKNIFSVSLQVARSQKNKGTHETGNGGLSAPPEPHHEQNINIGKKECNIKFKVTKTPPYTATKLGPHETIEEFFEKNVGHLNSTTLKGTCLKNNGGHQTQDHFLEVNPKGGAREKQTNSSTE